MATRSLSAAETAKLVRKALAAEFPGVKFSVRSKTYAGGASIRVGWTDGPPSRVVQAVCDRYRGADFDGMQDMKTYRESILADENGPELVRFGADFVFAERTISQEWRDRIARMIERVTGMPCDLSPRGDGWNTRYPAGVVDGRICLFGGGHLEYGGDLMRAYSSGRWRVRVPARKSEAPAGDGRRFDVIERRRWVLVAERLGGQRTARWFMDRNTGVWHPAESWKRPNLRYRLSAEQVAYVERVTGYGEGRA